jgi:rubrerythrin
VPREGEQLTGVSDNVYNLSSVLYHAAEGGTLYAKYIEDAEKEGDRDLVAFFREVQQQDAQRAKKASDLLYEYESNKRRGIRSTRPEE